MKLTGGIRCNFEKVTAENLKLKDRIPGYQETVSALKRSLKAARKSKDMQRADYDELPAQKDAVIRELENRLAHEPALKGHDGTNTGTPASQTPIGKKVALSLMDTVNAPVNKTAMFLSGLTAGGPAPCDGYISKLRNRAGTAPVQFYEDLRLLMITRTLLYRDDTVIMINTARACFRFYGDETIACYTAHLHKDMESLDDDRVLALLTADTKIMRDHNRVNCNDDRKDAIDSGSDASDDACIQKFSKKLDKILKAGCLQNSHYSIMYLPITCSVLTTDKQLLIDGLNQRQQTVLEIVTNALISEFKTK